MADEHEVWSAAYKYGVVDPTKFTKAQRTIWLKGYHAGCRGEARDSCPYKPTGWGLHARDGWMDGWGTAMDEVARSHIPTLDNGRFYFQKPYRKKSDGLVIYRCDDGSECSNLFRHRAMSPPMKELPLGNCWVCGDCMGNFM